MATLQDVNQDNLFCLFKGEPGVRKSTAALSFPGPQYWISTDQKMDALITPARNWQINPTDIEYDDYNNWDKPRKKLEQLQLNCKYRTIIIDSITSFADAINRQTIAIKSGSSKKDGEAKGYTIGGISVNTMEDYKAEASAFQELIAVLKDIHNYHKVNIILIAHVIGERKPEEARASTHFSRIIVTGGKIISAKIPAYCSEVYHFNIDKKMLAEQEGDYTILTTHTGDDFARTSLPLDRKLIFNGDKLYDKFLKPAIEKNRLTPIKGISPATSNQVPINPILSTK